MAADELPSPTDRLRRSPGPAPVPGGKVRVVREHFLDFYAEQYPQVVRFVMVARHATLQAAEDAAQEAFIEAWRTAHSPGAWDRIKNREAWIRTIALRRHLRPGGTRNRQPPTVAGADDLVTDRPSSQPDPADLATGTMRVLQALHAVDDDHARAVMAFTLDGYPDRVIATQLDLDPQQVRNLRTKARTLLRRHLATSRAQEGGTR
jgi:RNA polymerase sigma factor (sigma-70 family)